LEMMTKELRMAGYDPDKNWNTGFTTASESTVQFTLVADEDSIDNDDDGATDEAGELKTVQFSLFDGYSDGSTDLGRTVGSGNPEVLIENVDKLAMRYTLVNGDQTWTPASTDLTSDRIRSIDIFLVVRASEAESVGYTNTETYTLPSTPSPVPASWAGGGNSWTPGDSFRRRMQAVTVNCRNMGW